VDRHQPAYWLSRDPAEAAEFLARTAVASRAVGGFVKTALDPGMQEALTNAAFGAGIGGLGGLGVGLFSKRKKNPLTTALTGAALGGVLGGAVPAAYKAWTAPAATGPTPAETAIDAQNRKTYEGMGGVDRFLVSQGLKKLPAPGDAGVAAAGGPPTQLEQAQAKDSPWKQLGDATGFGQRPALATGVVGGTLAAQAAAKLKLSQMRNDVLAYKQFQQGLAGSKTIPVATVGAGGARAYPYGNNQPFATAEDALTRRWGDALSKQVGDARFPWLREARAGRMLGQMVGKPGASIGGIQGLQPGTIGAMRQAGASHVPAAPKPGMMRRGAGFVGNLLPALAAMAYMKYTEPQQ
jgi:hypothetical protein